MIATNAWFWIVFVAFVLAMLALDLGVFHRKAHEVKPREATIWTIVWVALAFLFAGGLHLRYGADTSVPFITGYLIEKALSVDNIFVIVLIFDYFRVPKIAQHRVLFYGILGALVMRGIFIGLGALLIAKFHWIIYVFGAVLIITGIRMAAKHDEQFDGDQNPVVRFTRRFLPMTADYRGAHLFTVENGRRIATPLMLVLLLIEATDLIFAVDSIPAIFGITRDPFIVFTSNVFAILGLRTLYFLLAAVVDRFYLLKYGLAGILVFIGVKMVGEPFFHIPIGISLLVVLAMLAAAVVASLVWPQRAGGEPQPEGRTGSIFGSRPRPPGGPGKD